ncbi:MAG TPA: DUF262 domain-containing protein [Acidothermaceae bacterium]
MTEPELDLGEDDYDEVVDIPAKDRRLLTQSYDLSVSTLLEQWNDGTLELPEIQRQYVWDNTRASRLIESLLLNIPIPVVYFAETEEVKYLVIDGHQRIQSMARYVNNEFALSGLKILGELRNKRFHQLHERDQRQIKTRVVRAIILSVDSDPMMKFDVFERLNTGSIALNAQEVRNSTHRGSMSELIKRLTQVPEFRRCIGVARPRPRMVDNELILRYMALEDGWKSYRPPLSRFLNDYLVRANAFLPDDLESAAVKFEMAVTGLLGVFPNGAFRLTDASGEFLERGVNRSLAQVQLTSFAWIANLDSLLDRRAHVLTELGRLHADRVFLDSIQRATGDKRRTLRRLGMYCEALERAGLTIIHDVPYEKSE